MPSTREIRRRIVSVKKTAQITSAMEKVAQAKMGRAQQAAMAGRPYAELMNRVLGEVVTNAGDFDHPFMKARGGENRALILVTTDKGMCGSINSNLLRKVSDEFVTDHTRVIAAGRKGAQHATRVGWDLTADFSYSDTPVFAEARAIARIAVELFENGEVDHVDIAFTNFINTLSQKPEVQTLLPITEIKGVQAGVEGEEMVSELQGGTAEFLFEPSAGGVLGALLPHYINFQVHQILLEAKASEFSSKMVAMKNATDNANDLIKDLTLEFNKMRQAAITNELLEITTAQMALGN
ncbi:MAG: ATP synthase F1 subunit gamma [Verrucomicrobia bacterium]|jgi:F-type H+-transporting ATPase subunit gamma|nr:ATP synthase F1 subunit gamma [Verrucomicrobiota bacterium]MBT3914066.1 ATP synthase F1 subunit gamma [Verrucomicrobiota bacterium]MBT4903361.1 ATP synthase F1 subunit gamma [Verrucomicrobiota bacterium]MBT6661166.1 ATP synthase F1 subunit gamma [Verrucomicrobiota bacterium]MBT6789800.1 ATP synthase F1 subunit gamma [Verrucomicrobiota bacterium]